MHQKCFSVLSYSVKCHVNIRSPKSNYTFNCSILHCELLRKMWVKYFTTFLLILLLYTNKTFQTQILLSAVFDDFNVVLTTLSILHSYLHFKTVPQYFVKTFYFVHLFLPQISQELITLMTCTFKGLDIFLLIFNK